MTTTPIVLRSELDPSVNTVISNFETRYVSRQSDAGEEAIIYLSSFKGCDQACRMCWLTQSGQTDMTPASLKDFLDQAELSLAQAFERSVKLGKVPAVMHFNFMARGEPLLNKVVMNHWPLLSDGLIQLTKRYFGEIPIKFKISTIMTGIYIRDQEGVIIGGYSKLPFEVNKPEIYYSLYSMNPEFRKRWLPKAEAPRDMLRLLSDYRLSGGQVRLHCAFILGHNDSIENVDEMYRSAKFYNLHEKFNIVRFNSPDETKWVEPEEEDLLAIKAYLESKGVIVQMVPRVGTDIAASCGTFLNLL